CCQMARRCRTRGRHHRQLRPQPSHPPDDMVSRCRARDVKYVATRGVVGMANRLITFIVASAAGLAISSVLRAQTLPWNNSGLAQSPNQQQQTGPAGPAPKRDLTGIWDAGGAGIGARGYTTAPLTPCGEALGKTHKSGDGARQVAVEQINDPLSTMG